MAMETTGFIVEIGLCVVKFYTLDQGVQLRNKSELMNHKPGDWFKIFDAESQYYEKCEARGLPHFSTWEQDNTCYAKLLAVKPKKLLEQFRNKHEGAVWSPFLLYLNDSNGILENIRGTPTGVIVKYAPLDDKLFEIVSLVEWDGHPREEKLDIYWFPPWRIELFASQIEPSNYLNPLNGCINSNQYINKNHQAVGICIAHKEHNPVQKKHGEQDSSPPPEFTSYLWSQRFGLTRWLIPPGTEHRASSLGRWFSHQRQPTTFDKKMRNNVDFNTHVLFQASAFKVFSVAARKEFNVTKKAEEYQRSKDDEYQLEIEVSFPFERKNIAGDCLSGEVRRDAHFFDVELGKVEIYPRQGRLILEKVNNHLEELLKKDKVEYENAKKDVIIIDATVIVHKNFLTNFKNYQKYKNGLFMVYAINRIHYSHGGQTIWQKE